MTKNSGSITPSMSSWPDLSAKLTTIFDRDRKGYQKRMIAERLLNNRWLDYKAGRPIDLDREPYSNYRRSGVVKLFRLFPLCEPDDDDNSAVSLIRA